MTSEFFQEWRTADRLASAAERSVLAATLKGEPLGEAAVATAKELRQIADDLFHVAMREMKAEAERLKRR